MLENYLDFEQPIAVLEKKIHELQSSELLEPKTIEDQILKLNESAAKLTEKIYSNLSAWQNVQVARHPQRPHFLDYVEKLCDDFDELHGDRHYADDRAIIGGLASIGDHKVILIGHEKGRSTEEKIKHNFGMAQPEGYRKACRLMKTAERFNLPVVTLVDTPGAYPGIDSEERGQSEAIAYNLSVMSSLKTPILVNIVGAGGSGGALALAVGDHISMMQYATYSVASPEACASIVWRDSSKAPDAAKAMKLNSENLLKLELIDEILQEPLGGSHRHHEQAGLNLKKFKTVDLVERRYERLMGYGSL
jgi:acetyl-CoA carboxylase carboxyl transferase subunit alpha